MIPPAPLRLTVLGSGSVGLAVAATFAQSGQAVTLLARGAAVPDVQPRGAATLSAGQPG